MLKLKINRAKSAVGKPSRIKFLGFSFYIRKGITRNFIHKKPVKRFKERVREITSRSNGKSMDWRKETLNYLVTVNYHYL